ncbi:GATA zinc finger domain-containing protein 1-like [Acanthaster planci]|uniref:GATA zinc finger domain-containing protein 1 n=1 Tax=Acanthaster planci TaxID=133434 RepID=A0A8B7XM84_ACAPL|nr:GATA zinc finger domain-containing protein 1-like [Acanthaster planci]
MPLGEKPFCLTCKTTNSVIWRQSSDGKIQCNSCGLKHPGTGDGSEDGRQPSTGATSGQNGGGASGRLGREGTRKSARTVKKLRYKQIVNAAKSQATKGKNRRIIFKRHSMKAPEANATVVTSNSVFHHGVYLQAGDIVSILDVEGGIYYAQIRGFLQDQYGDKSAVITWLLPTQATDKKHFDPATYILGPEEELPRSLEYLEFVCHAPSEYYRSRTTPLPVDSLREEKGFIWSSVMPQRPPSTAAIFGGKS